MSTKKLHNQIKQNLWKIKAKEETDNVISIIMVYISCYVEQRSVSTKV